MLTAIKDSLSDFLIWKRNKAPIITSAGMCNESVITCWKKDFSKRVVSNLTPPLAHGSRSPLEKMILLAVERAGKMMILIF